MRQGLRRFQVASVKEVAARNRHPVRVGEMGIHAQSDAIRLRVMSAHRDLGIRTLRLADAVQVDRRVAAHATADFRAIAGVLPDLRQGAEFQVIRIRRRVGGLVEDWFAGGDRHGAGAARDAGGKAGQDDREAEHQLIGSVRCS